MTNKRPIYLEDTPQAWRAQAACDSEARNHGYQDWHTWYEDERQHSDALVSTLESFNAMMDITRRYEKH